MVRIITCVDRIHFNFSIVQISILTVENLFFYVKHFTLDDESDLFIMHLLVLLLLYICSSVDWELLICSCNTTTTKMMSGNEFLQKLNVLYLLLLVRITIIFIGISKGINFKIMYYTAC